MRLGNIEGTAAPKTTDNTNTKTNPNRTRTRQIAVSLAPAAAVFLLQQAAFPVSSGVFVRGLIVGALTALVALGLALVHRVNHIINFAQADFGLLPAALAFLVMTESGVAWGIALAVGLAVAVGLGVGAERVVVRRFFHAPRLLATVATLGLSQLLAGAAILLPNLWNTEISGQPRMPAPVAWSATLGGAEFTIYDVLALALAPAAIAAVVIVLQRSNLGSAIRACGDSKDRALLLGVPLFGLHNLVWGFTAALAFAAVFLRSGMLELPLVGPTLAFGLLLRALAAFWLGRLAGFTGIVSVSVALGALELGVAEHHHPLMMEPILLVIVLGSLLLGRWRAHRDRAPGRDEREQAGRSGEPGETSRANGDGESAWQTPFPGAFREVHAVPEGLARLPQVRAVRWVLLASAGWLALSLPMTLSPDGRREITMLLIYILVGLSLVVVSGWAGRLAAGQVGCVATGAVVGAWTVLRWDLDLLVALALVALVGAALAVAVGMPAWKLPGHYAAVTTFAFAVAAVSLFNPQVFDWVPEGRVVRTPLVAGWHVADGTFRVYYLVLVIVVAAMAGVYHLRRSSQLGRVTLALRDSEPVARACGIDGALTQLAVYALSGAIAAVAGALFMYSEQSYGVEPYVPLMSIAVLSMMVVGGLTSVGGAVLGALFLMGSRWLLPADWEMLAIGVGMLLVLLYLPSGFASVLYDVRDRGLRALVREEPADVPPMRSKDLRTNVPRVDLDVRPGETIALVGPNRAGKTSVLRALSGLAPQEGTVTFDGHRFDGLPTDQVRALGLVQVPSSRGVFPTLTVAENLQVASWPHQHDPATVAACMDRAIGLYPVLGDRAGDPAGDLPTGDQQRLALAMAVVSRPRLLMADELALGPAPVAARELGRFARHLRDEGAALLFVTSSPKVARRLAKRTVHLEERPAS